MLADQAAINLTRRFQTRLLALGDTTAAATVKAWDELASHDTADVATFARRVAPVTAGSKTASVALANGYYATLTEVRAASVTVAAIPTLFDPRSGFLAYWHALKEGRPYVEALEAGRSMTQAASLNAVVSTSRRTGDAFVAASGQRTVGWRRALDGGACEWCQVISTQRYRTAESADFGHDRCGCTPVPIIGDQDPGRVINRELLAELKASGTVDAISASRR